MKKTLISVGLLSLLIAGCNLTDFRLPTVGESNSNSTATTKTASSSKSDPDIVSNPLIEEMCATAKKNEVRANELYRGRVVSAKGKFRINTYTKTPYIDFDTLNFSVVMDMNDKTEPWKQYDDGQIVSSGSIKVSKVSVESYAHYDICYIGN